MMAIMGIINAAIYILLKQNSPLARSANLSGFPSFAILFETTSQPAVFLAEIPGGVIGQTVEYYLKRRGQFRSLGNLAAHCSSKPLHLSDALIVHTGNGE